MAKETETIKLHKGTLSMILKAVGPAALAGVVAAGGVGMSVSQNVPDPQDIKETRQALEALKESAPTRKEVEELFNLFREMRDSQLRMEARQTALGDSQSRDRAELQRQIDDNKRLLDRLEKAMIAGVSRAEFEALRNEVDRLRGK